MLELGKTETESGPWLWPDDAVTQTMGILAVKRAGKSNAAVVLAEELYKAGLPWVAIDPKGDWWGVRSSGNGKGPGLSVPVFGGLHGDVPLEPTGGNLVADLVAEQHLTCVLDVSEMTKADTRRFLTDFASRLYKRNREPLMVFCEEADEYIPQRVVGENARMVGAFETLVKRGGFRGIGVTLITQRSASLNKDVLTQVGSLLLLRTTSPQDRKAIAGWLDYHAESADVLTSLPTLPNGEAWLVSPEWLKTLERVRFRRRATFDSGATPEVGKVRREPTGLADVDLAAIKDAMAETVERAKENDPAELRKRIKELETALRTAQNAAPAPAERIMVPLVPDHAIEELGTLSSRLGELLELGRPTTERLGELLHTMDEGSKTALAVVAGQPAPGRGTAVRPQRKTPAQATPAAKPAREESRNRGTNRGSGATLPGAQKKLLTVLATYGPRTKRQLALQAGYAESGGGFNNPLGAIRSAGYVDPPKGEPIAITEAGLEALGPYEPLPMGQDLLEHWLATLPGAAKKILTALVEHGAMGKVELAAATGYEPTGGGFNNPLGRLRTLGLVNRGEPVDLTDEFAEAIA
jgi:hypothetical protein